MLINCKPGCTGKRVTTNGSLDVEQDEVVCTTCNEIIPVSKFVKMSMKNQGDVIRKDNRKPFQYNCITCKKKVETVLNNGKLVGIDCQGSCQFNVSKFTLLAMKNITESSHLQKITDEESEELE